MQKFWTCWVVGTDGGYGQQHQTIEAATNEAERLARLHQNHNRAVYVLELVGCCLVPQAPVQWQIIEQA